jgi:hypothetical protein
MYYYQIADRGDIIIYQGKPMAYIENRSTYQADPGLHHPAYDWSGKLAISSASYRLSYCVKDVLTVFSVMKHKPHDVQWVETRALHKTEGLEIGIRLDADNRPAAFTKMSGLALLVMRKSEIDIHEVSLEGAFLASQAELAEGATPETGGKLRSDWYAVEPPLLADFDDIQASMLRYGSPATY